jgi:hypothetical protein
LKRIEVPEAPLEFIKDCISGSRIRWTYHVTMRLQQRSLAADFIETAIDSLEILESYPQDKYLPSFLVRGESNRIVFHAHIATT